MNFFGHAVVAGWHRESDAYALGAMLPDLAGMSGARVSGTSHPEIAAGIELHYRTDAVFHVAPTFQRMCSRARGALMTRGVSRGAALGAAHVGIELLLDGVLTDAPGAAERYGDALELAGDPAIAATIVWRDDDPGRWQWLHERLRAHGVPRDYRSPATVADRIRRVLSRRPRLALAAAELPVIEAWLEEERFAVERETPAMLGELRAGLVEREARARLQDAGAE